MKVLTHFFWPSCSREEGPVVIAMNRDEKHGGIIVKYLLRTITVMNILKETETGQVIALHNTATNNTTTYPINNGDLLILSYHCLGCQCDIIEIAECPESVQYMITWYACNETRALTLLDSAVHGDQVV